MFRLFIDIDKTYGYEKGKKVRDVCTVVYSKVKNRNIFGWRWFIEDVIFELANYMIVDNFSHPQGGYVMCGMQSALDKSRKCNALKRRGDYELVSLDEFFQVAESIEEEVNSTQQLLFDLELSFGEKVKDELEPFLTGKVDSIADAVKKKLKTPEFRKFLKEHMKK